LREENIPFYESEIHMEDTKGEVEAKKRLKEESKVKSYDEVQVNVHETKGGFV
jgi:hypothetical protein